MICKSCHWINLKPDKNHRVLNLNKNITMVKFQKKTFCSTTNLKMLVAKFSKLKISHSIQKEQKLARDKTS